MTCPPNKYQIGKICNPISNRWVKSNQFKGLDLRLTQNWLSSFNTDLYMYLRPRVIEYIKKSPLSFGMACLSDLNMFVKSDEFLYQNYFVIVDEYNSDKLNKVQTAWLNYFNNETDNTILNFICQNYGFKPPKNKFQINKQNIVYDQVVIMDFLSLKIDKTQIVYIKEIPYLNYRSDSFKQIYKQLLKELPQQPNNCQYLSQFIDNSNYNMNHKLYTLPVNQIQSVVTNLNQCLSKILYGNGSSNNLFNLHPKDVDVLTLALNQLSSAQYELITSYTKHSSTLNIDLIKYYETRDPIFLNSYIYDEDIAPGTYMSYQPPLKTKPSRKLLYDGYTVIETWRFLNQLIDDVTQLIYTRPSNNPLQHSIYKANNFYVYSIRNFVGVMKNGFVFNPNFVSTTYRADTGIDWLVKDGQMCCLFVIRIQEGQKFLLIGEGKGDLFYGDETEILLKAGSFFEITSVSKTNIYNNQITDFVVYYVDYIDDLEYIQENKLYQVFDVPPELQFKK